ncbi:MAG: ATP-binding protein [Actinobacteria bacterium]|nr:ATP-binding protein [Actinomycetota bacterium]
MADPAPPLTKAQRMERLLEISQRLNSTLELAPLLQMIVEVAVDLTDSEASSILLYDPASGELRFEAAPGIPRGDLSKLSVPLESSVAGWIFTHGKPMVVQDAARDARVFRKVDRTLNFQTRSLLGLPLLIKQEAIGVIEAVNKKGQGHYTEDDLAVLETLAAQAAIASENARLLAKLQDANAELMRLDRMKSDFIAIASHELRTPLGLILGHATFLKEVVPQAHQEQMEVIIRSSMRLKSIIEDLSTIAHKDEGQSRVRREPFSIVKLIIDLASRFQEAAQEKNIELGYDVPESDPLIVEADRDKIDVALGNLIRNALTFTDAGGQVGIKAEGEGGYVKVFVVDTGIGIPAGEIDRIFDRFYQVESHLTRRHGGMGLGLSIAKSMIEMHNGQIWVESKEGTGSLFSFTLPVNERQASAASKVFRS